MTAIRLKKERVSDCAVVVDGGELNQILKASGQI